MAGGHRAKPYLRALDRLVADPRVIAAARIGHAFAMDPCAVLSELDWRRTLIREAAFVVVAQDRAREWGDG